jgi:hypothetical protein
VFQTRTACLCFIGARTSLCPACACALVMLHFCLQQSIMRL